MREASSKVYSRLTPSGYVYDKCVSYSQFKVYIPIDKEP